MSIYRYKTLLKILAFPVVILLTAVQWMMVFLIGFSSILLYGLGFSFWLIAVTFHLIGVMSGAEIFGILLVGFVFFMIPVAGVGLSVVVTAAKARLRYFIMND